MGLFIPRCAESQATLLADLLTHLSDVASLTSLAEMLLAPDKSGQDGSRELLPLIIYGISNM